MKQIFFRLLMAAALTLAAFALSAPAHGQQADQDPTPTSPSQQKKPLQPPHGATAPAQAPNSSSSNDQTQDELAFTGRIEQEDGALMLKDPITKLSYQLNDSARAKKFIGKQVKVTGKLEMKSNMIQINTIEVIPSNTDS
jgi:hypothetical protein